MHLMVPTNVGIYVSMKMNVHRYLDLRLCLFLRICPCLCPCPVKCTYVSMCLNVSMCAFVCLCMKMVIYVRTCACERRGKCYPAPTRTWLPATTLFAARNPPRISPDMARGNFASLQKSHAHFPHSLTVPNLAP